MEDINSELRDVTVVDSCPQDYLSLVAGLTSQQIPYHLLLTGEDALRRTGLATSGLWLINMDLPDMRGTDLLGLVRQRTPTVPVFLVGDNYSSQEELAARAAGSTAYLCKPPNFAWLEEWARTVRAGPRDQSLSSHPLLDKALATFSDLVRKAYEA